MRPGRAGKWKQKRDREGLSLGHSEAKQIGRGCQRSIQTAGPPPHWAVPPPSCCPVSVAQLFTTPLGNPVGRYCKSNNRVQGNNCELRLWVPGKRLFLEKVYCMTYEGSLLFQVLLFMTFLPRRISHPKTLTNKQPNCYIGGLEPHGIKTTNGTLKVPQWIAFPSQPNVVFHFQRRELLPILTTSTTALNQPYEERMS